MKISSDPVIHRHREQQLVQHVQRLLSDDRLRVDTSTGNRSITTLIRDVIRTDHGTDLKRLMSEMGLPDRELQARMPVGETVEVTLGQKRFFFFRQTVGRIKVVCVSPTRALLEGEEPEPMSTAEVQKLLDSIPPSVNGAPQTVVLMNTGGFTQEAHELADRGRGRTVILIEPDPAGGWTVTGPPEAKTITDLFDPEGEADKRQRAREAIEDAKLDLIQGGLSVEKLASRTKLPAPLVEAEMKAYAKANPGLVAKKMDGRVVLFREGLALPGSGTKGALDMPFWENIKTIFGRKESSQSKVARLTAEKVGLSQQRDTVYELIEELDRKETELAAKFDGASSLTQRKIATEIAQLRSEIERRHQLLSTIDKKVNIVNTAIHKLEIERQVGPEQLRGLEAVSESSEDLEAGLATLEQLDEEADSLGAVSASEVPDKVQKVMDELRAKSKAASASPVAETPADSGRQASASPEPSRLRDRTPPPLPPESEARRGRAEPG